MGRRYISGTPNASQAGIERRARDWLANLVAHPEFTVRLKTSVHVDLPATAARVADPTEHRHMSTAPNTEYYRNAVSLEVAIALSPMVRVQFAGDATSLNSALNTQRSELGAAGPHHQPGKTPPGVRLTPRRSRMRPLGVAPVISGYLGSGRLGSSDYGGLVQTSGSALTAR